MQENLHDKVRTILTETSNRQYALPVKPWLFYQEWHNVLLFHWAVDAEMIRGFIPYPMELDLFEGKAYISVIGFGVSQFRTSMTGPVPFISDFKELNVRTYVSFNGIKGVYFFSLHVDKFLASWGSRLFYQLPYRKASLNLSKSILYCESRHDHKVKLLVNYRDLSGFLDKTALDLWLTERHAFYQTNGNRLYRCDIHHVEWPLQKAVIYSGRIGVRIMGPSEEIVLTDMPQSAQFAKKLEVLFWNRIRVY